MLALSENNAKLVKFPFFRITFIVKMCAFLKAIKNNVNNKFLNLKLKNKSKKINISKN